MMKRYINKLGKILLLAGAMLAGGDGVAWGQTINSNVKNENVVETTETIYAVEGKSKTIYFQFANTGNTLNGYIRWYIENSTSEKSRNGLQPVDGTVTSSTINDSNAELVIYSDSYAWASQYNLNRNVSDYGINGIMPPNSCKMTVTDPQDGDVIVCEATSWTDCIFSSQNTSLTEPTLSIRRKYVIKLASEMVTNLEKKATAVTNDKINWQHPNYTPLRDNNNYQYANYNSYDLPSAFINNPQKYFLENYEIHTPISTTGNEIVGTSYRLANILSNYYVSNETGGEARYVRWSMYDATGKPTTNGTFGRYGTSDRVSASSVIIHQSTTDFAVYRNTDPANVLDYTFPVGANDREVQQIFYITAEVSNDNSEWYPVSFLKVYLEPNSAPMLPDELEDENNPRSAAYFKNHGYIQTNKVSFEWDKGDTISLSDLKKDLSLNYRSEPIKGAASYYAYAYPNGKENNYRKNHSVGAGEYGLYRTLNYDGVSESNNGYDDYWTGFYRYPVADRTFHTSDHTSEETTNTGYFFYVDAADEAGVITELTLDKKLCPITRIFVTAWVCNLAYWEGNGVANADIGFTFKGKRQDGQDDEILNKFYTGAIPRKEVVIAGDTYAAWQQVYFEFQISNTEDYSSYTLEVANNCRHSDGADYAIDDIEIYISTPNIKVERRDVCDASTLEVRSDYETLLRNMGWEKNGVVTTGFNFEDLDYKKYRYGLMGEESHDPKTNSNIGNVYFSFLDKEDNGKWILINEQAKIDAVKYSIRVAVSTNIDVSGFPETEEEALQAERTLNIRAVNDYNHDIELWKNQDADLHSATIEINEADTNDEIYSTAIKELYNRLGIPRIRCPWKKMINGQQMLFLTTIDVNETELKYRGQQLNSGDEQVADGEYRVLLFSAGQVVNADNITIDDCSLLSPFVVQPATTIRIDTETNTNTALCAGALRKITAELNGYDIDGNPIDLKSNGIQYIFDWYLGSEDAYMAEMVNQKSIKEILLDYRETMGYGIITSETVDEWMSQNTGYVDEGAAIKKLLLPDEKGNVLLKTGTKGAEAFDLIVNSEQIIAMPYVYQKESSEVEYLYCTDITIVELGKLGDDIPQIYTGFNGVTYPFEEGAPLRLGKRHLNANQISLVIPIRNDFKMVDNATQLGTGEQNQVLLNSPATLEPVGTLVKLNVVKGAQDATMEIQWNTDAQNLMQEGHSYELLIPFVQKNGEQILDAACDGLASLTVKIVPEYLTWSGDANGLWYNDNNWEQSTKGELYKDGDAGTSTDDANGTDDIKNAFSPLYFTKVTVNPEKIVDGKASVLPLREEKTTLATETDKHTLNFGADGMNLDAATDATSKSGVTPNIQYDMAVDGEITNGTDNPNNWSIVPYYGNKVDQIYFKPGAQLQRQQELEYNTARVEFEMDKDAKYWLASPLKDVYAGDMYAPKGTGRQTTYAFAKIEYNGEGGSNDRQNPSFYQKAWDKGVDIYTNAEGANKETYSVVKSNWSVEYNDVNVPYALGKGFYASVEDFTNEENKALVRLPKEDVSYTYEELKTKAATSLSKTNGGKLADGAEITVTLSSDDNASNADGDGKHFLLGNPYMYPLSLESFFAENTMLANKVWTLNGGTAIVGTPDLVNGWNTGESLTEIPPMQAFFVELKDGLTVETTTQTVTFSTSMMKSDDETSRATLRSSITASHPVLRLTAEKGEKRSIAFLTQRDDASNAYESDKDAITLLDSELTEIPQVYTIAGDRAAGVNAVKTINNIPLGVYTASDKDEVALTIEGISNLPAALYLYDAKTKENKVLTGDSYTLNLTGATHGRYFLRSGDMPTGNEAIEGNNISIYSVVRGEVIVSATEPLKQIQVVAPSGQVVRSFFPRQAVYSFNLPQGIYIIRAESQTAIKTVKLQVR